MTLALLILCGWVALACVVARVFCAAARMGER